METSRPAYNRKSCRLAINNSLNENFRDCDTLFRQRRMGAFWRKIKKSRSNECDNFKCISIDNLENHFREKLLTILTMRLIL